MVQDAPEIHLAQELMTDYARRTGLVPPDPHPRRYLWTDAFAVCNYLELDRLMPDTAWQDRALRLVDQVHHILGRYRPDDPRVGWISSLPEEEGGNSIQPQEVCELERSCPNADLENHPMTGRNGTGTGSTTIT